MNLRYVLGADHSFDPDEVTLVVAAYEGALRDLRLVNREDPATIIVAKRIIELAKLGERDPARLRAAGENALK